MTAIETRLDDILAHPMRAALGSGPRAFGYVGLDIPPDLLSAPGRVSCHLPWRKHASTPRASSWLETSFPGWAFSIVEDWAAGAFESFQHVVFSRGDDASHRLYYYICELQRRGRIGGPQPLVFDVAKIPRKSSCDHSVLALRRLMQQLGVSDEQLVEGISRANRLRELFKRLRHARGAPGRVYEKLVRASLFEDVSGLLDNFSPGAAGPEDKTVVLVGSAPPDDSLHRAVEGAGWTVVDELYDRSLYRLGDLVTLDPAHPAKGVVARWLDQSSGKRGFADPAQCIAGSLGSRKVDAAVIWSMREDEALAWRVPSQRAALAAAGIPTLVLTARSWNVDDGAAGEIDSFLRGLR
jgi:hypothetical protein